MNYAERVAFYTEQYTQTYKEAFNTNLRFMLKDGQIPGVVPLSDPETVAILKMMDVETIATLASIDPAGMAKLQATYAQWEAANGNP